MNTVTATLVSKANASNDQEELQDAVSQALIVGFFISLVGSTLMMAYPQKILSSILKGMMMMKFLLNPIQTTLLTMFCYPMMFIRWCACT